MVSRKRDREEMEADDAPTEPSLLEKIRNMWEFACLMQYIHFFGDAVKIDNELDIDELEAECLKPIHSEKLSQIGLALLKYVSSHKGLTPEIFDEYTRRQYMAKAPDRNPFGTEEAPNSFADFDIFTKIRVLHQLSVWTLGNADRIRERAGWPENKQTEWRIEPFGWDTDDRTYFLLDDNRLYRRTDPLIPESPKPKPKPKPKKSKGSRASKRRKVAEDTPEVEEEAPAQPVQPEDNGFGGMTWECVAVTLDDYTRFLDSIARSRDPNEKMLRTQIMKHALPELERVAEERRQKEARKLKELQVMEQMSRAKRSSRIADKMEKRKEQEEVEAAERKRQADLVMARKEQERLKRREEDRESRMMTREQRIKEREMKRILEEEELAKLEAESQKVGTEEARISERHLKAEMEKRQKELEKLNQEDDWFFDCEVCGMHGENVDDGTHSMACEKCNVWQHSACHGITQEEAERPDFHFVCKSCLRKADEAKFGKIPPLKFRMTPSKSPKMDAATISTQEQQTNQQASNGTPQPAARQFQDVFIPSPTKSSTVQPPRQPVNVLNGPSFSPSGQLSGPPGSSQANGSYRQASASGPLSNYPSLQPSSASFAANGIDYINGGPTSSPPALHQSLNGVSHSSQPYSPNFSTTNMNATRPFLQPPTYGTNINPFVHHPTSALPPPGSSPTKLPSSSPPQQRNGYTTMTPSAHLLASSPGASFPPPGSLHNSQSPSKPPSPSQQIPLRPTAYGTMFSGMTPGYSPAKSSPRPESSHSVSSTPLQPPVAFMPNEAVLRMSPPTKKMGESFNSSS